MKAMQHSGPFALLSVSNKENLLPLAKAFMKQSIGLIATSGTFKYLATAGINAMEVSEWTEFPEIMSGRVKSLHPKIFGGILGKRDVHAQEAFDHKIPWIQWVIVNLYPFEHYLSSPMETAIEQIDIGGSALIRAGAKNYPWVTVVTDPSDYDRVIQALGNTELNLEAKKYFAQKAFAYTAKYDVAIANYFEEKTVDLLHNSTAAGNFSTSSVLASSRISIYAAVLRSEEVKKFPPSSELCKRSIRPSVATIKYLLKAQKTSIKRHIKIRCDNRRSSLIQSIFTKELNFH